MFPPEQYEIFETGSIVGLEAMILAIASGEYRTSPAFRAKVATLNAVCAREVMPPSPNDGEEVPVAAHA